MAKPFYDLRYYSTNHNGNSIVEVLEGKGLERLRRLAVNSRPWYRENAISGTLSSLETLLGISRINNWPNETLEIF